MSNPVSFHTAEESIFQSALLELLAADQTDQTESAIPASGLASDHPLMVELSAALSTQDLGEAELSVFRGCAARTIELAKARALGRREDIQRLENLLTTSNCDPRWATIAVKAAEYYKLLRNRPVYRPPASNDDFVYKMPSAATVTIGLIADWGSGEQIAEMVLEQTLAHKPDIVIHLGDVYYSGTAYEQAHNFTAIVNRARANVHPCVLYNLPGNHDYYAGGAAFYDELQHLNRPPAAPPSTKMQEASFFCLRNDAWQIHGLDTGYHDFDYFKHVKEFVGAEGHATKLRDDELAWHHHQLANAGDRRVVFLSHHQLFSAYSKIGSGYVNRALQQQFKKALDRRQIDAWFWGHEHTLQLYEEQFGLPKGRCIGHGAFPVFSAENLYATADDSNIKLMLDHRRTDIGTYELAAHDGVYDHGYAILKLRPVDQPSEAIYYVTRADGSEAGSREFFREVL